MKAPFKTLLLASGAAMLIPLSLSAQNTDLGEDRKPTDETIRPAAPPDERPGRGEPRERRGRGERPRPLPEKPTPFIGVVTRELGPEVRAQAGVPDGFGLLVAEVLPDSPAKDGGLRQHDVLVQFGDQRLVNVGQLSALVRSQKKGDEVSLTVKRGGEEKKLTVKIGERMMPEMPEPGPGWDFRIHTPFGSGEWHGPGTRPFGQMADEWRERAERFQNQLREYQERIQEWSRGPKDRPMPPVPQFEGGPGLRGPDREPPPPGAGRESVGRPRPEGGGRANAETRVELHAEGPRVTLRGTVSRSDDSGEYTIRRENGKATFSVRTRDGKEQSWPINSQEEREAVPEVHRGKLRELESIKLEGRSDPNQPPHPEGNPPPDRESPPKRKGESV